MYSCRLYFAGDFADGAFACRGPVLFLQLFGVGCLGWSAPAGAAAVHGLSCLPLVWYKRRTPLRYC